MTYRGKWDVTRTSLPRRRAEEGRQSYRIRAQGLSELTAAGRCHSCSTEVRAPFVDTDTELMTVVVFDNSLGYVTPRLYT